MKTDDDLQLMKELLGRLRVPKEVNKYTLQAFEEEYDEISDGCTMVPDLHWAQLFTNSQGKFTHPICIFHDYVIEKGIIDKFRADILMYQGMLSFGHWFVAPIYLVGLQTLGWVYHWYGRRKVKQNKI